MYAAHAQRQLTEHTVALEERLTGLLRCLAGLVDELEDARGQVRVALVELEHLRGAQQAHTRAVHEQARG